MLDRINCACAALSQISGGIVGAMAVIPNPGSPKKRMIDSSKEGKLHHHHLRCVHLHPVHSFLKHISHLSSAFFIYLFKYNMSWSIAPWPHHQSLAWQTAENWNDAMYMKTCGSMADITDTGHMLYQWLWSEIPKSICHFCGWTVASLDSEPSLWCWGGGHNQQHWFTGWYTIQIAISI